VPASRPAAGGGRWVEVGRPRVEGWLRRFDERHAVDRTVARDYGIELRTKDGSVAECHAPFPPLTGDCAGPALVVDGLLEHLTARRRVGVLLVRLGGFAVGIFDDDRLIASKVDSRQVHGRASAGGWSQKRFARRREGQVRAAGDAAADVAVRLLCSRPLDFVITGGERRAVAAVLADERLTAIRPMVVDRFLTVPDPKKTVLDAVPEQFNAVHIRVIDPPP
jgi:hypothetical protein